MRYEDFREKIADEIRKTCIERGFYRDPDVNIRKVVKDNGKELYGLSITEAGAKNAVCPTIYLEDFFPKYKEGDSLDVIAGAICVEYEKHRVPQSMQNIGSEIADMLCSKEYIKDHIYPRLCSLQSNPEWAATMPHRLHGDLMEICYIEVDVFGKEGFVKVNNEAVKAIGADEDWLFEQAHVNMKKKNPAYAVGMRDMLMILSVGGGFDQLDTFDRVPDLEPGEMMALVTKNKDFGAVAVLDTELISEISERYGDLYLLPSSIHEFLAVPQAGYDVAFLRQMVRDINRTEVAPEEVLSDEIYEMRQGKLVIAMTDEERELRTSVNRAADEQAKKPPKRRGR